MNDPAKKTTMPAESDDDAFADDPYVMEAMAWYANCVDQGEVPDRSSIMQKFPDAADRLLECFEAFDLIQDAIPHEIASSEKSELGDSATIGDFRLVREIGRGGMGVVYEAEQISLDRRVAVKVLPFAALLDRRQLERFRNEARAAAMLRHPNIVGVYSVGCERSVNFFAMELIEGCSLADIAKSVNRRDPSLGSSRPDTSDSVDTKTIAALSTKINSDQTTLYRNVAELGQQVALALHYAHQQGVIHRDIKPANLLVDQDCNVWITDFGLAHIQSSDNLTLTGDVVGTLRYMSPEQLSGDGVVDQRTDVYALGLTLFELLAGRPAFESKNRQELIQQLHREQPRFPNGILRTLPKNLATIVLKATAKEPEHRYRTAQAMADDLRRFLENRPILARRNSLPQRVWCWCRNNRSKAALLALIVGLLVTAAIGSTVVAVQQSSIAERQRRELYDADMLRAHQHLERNEIGFAVELLKKHIPSDQSVQDLRNFEWRHLWRESHRHESIATVENWAAMFCAAYSPDGKSIAYGTWDGSLSILDASTFKQRWTSKRTGMVYDVAFSADGTWLATASQDGSIRLWDLKSGDQIGDVLQVPGHVSRHIAISKDNVLAAGLSRPFETTSFPNDQPTAIARWRVSISTDNEDSKPQITELPRLREGLVGDVEAIEFSPDGRLLAAGSHDSILRIWDLSNDKLTASMSGHLGPIMDVTFAPDGQSIAASSGLYDREWRCGEVLIWDISSGQQLQAIRGNKSIVRDVEFTTDGSQIVSGGDDLDIRVWDVQTGELLEEIDAHRRRIRCLAISPDGNRIVSGGSDNRLRVWDYPRSAEVSQLTGHKSDVEELSFSPDGSLLASASADHTVRMWSLPTGTLWHDLQGHGSQVLGATFSPDGAKVVSVSSEWPTPTRPGELRVWDSRSGDAIHTELFPNHPYIRSLAISHDGKHVVLAAKRNILLWDIARNKVHTTRELPGDSFRVLMTKNRVIVSHESKMQKSGKVSVLSYPGLEPIQMPIWEGGNGTFGIAVSKDERTIAVSGGESHDIQLFDLATGEVFQTLHGHASSVLAMDFSLDGRRLASCGMDSTLLVWNVETGNTVLADRNQAGWWWTTKFSPDGNMLVVGGGNSASDGLIRILRAEGRP